MIGVAGVCTERRWGHKENNVVWLCPDDVWREELVVWDDSHGRTLHVDRHGNIWCDDHIPLEVTGEKFESVR